MADWDPGAYARFREERQRPLIDLLLRCDGPPPGDLVDLGCGDGAGAALLRARFPKRDLIGVDSSPTMLAKARGYDRTQQADIADWVPERPPAIIFSNAALHWLPDHPALMPRLAGQLAPGGLLAVQMPNQFAAPSHRLIWAVAADLFPDRFGPLPVPSVLSPAAYHAILSAHGSVALWETEYLQVMPPSADAHPVRAFTASTAARPVLDRLAPAEQARFLAAYDAALAPAYPALADGRVLFPFRRLFFVLTRG